jgi:hemoglobin/transferrin/lactoferrin receptor protein
MKAIYVLILFLSNTVLYSQTIYIIDELTKKQISNANIFNASNGTVSNKKGAVDLSKFKSTDLISIQHISYINRDVLKSLINDTIYLIPNSYILKTITFEDVRVPLIYQSALSRVNKRKIQSLEINSTAELLKKSIGVTVQESQSGGGSPNFRGMEANRLLIVVDGIPLNNAIFRNGHVQSSSSINPFFIDNLSVVTGPSSVVYGDGAMGGAIIINTINNEIFTGTSNVLEQKYNSANNSSSLSYLSNFNNKKLSIVNGLAIKKSGNIKMGKNRAHGYENWGLYNETVRGNEQLNTGFNKYDAIQKIYIKINKKENVNLNSQFSTTSNISRYDKLNDMQYGQKKYKLWFYGPQTRIFQKINYNRKTTNFFSDKFSVILSWQNLKESRHKQKTNDLGVSIRKENVLILDGILDVKKTIKKIQLNYGLSYRYQHVESSAEIIQDNNQSFFNTTRYPDGGSNVVDGSIYTQVNWKLLKKTTIFLGERYNINSLYSKFDNNEIYNLPFSEITSSNNAFVSSVLINQKISKGISTNIAYYMGFRNPNVDDVGKIFSKNDYSVVIPNDNLKPEKTSNFEYSFIMNNEKIKFEAQYYRINIKDAVKREKSSLNGQDSIVYDGELMQIQMNQNIESAKIDGVSLATEIQFTNSTKIECMLNYLNGETDLKRPLAHIPPLSSHINLSYNYNKNNLILSYSYNGWKRVENYDDNGVDNIEEATVEGNPSWQTLDLKYINKLTKDIEMRISIENIFDVHYKTFGSGISAKGRNFILSLVTKF